MNKKLNSIIKPNLRHKLKVRGIPDFFSKADANKQVQSHIWNAKTYSVDPNNHLFTTIQERFGIRLIKSIVLPKNPVIVDIGCFIGEKLWQVKDVSGHLGIGIDIAHDSLVTAKQINPYGQQFIRADVENLPFVSNSVDLIMVFDVIEHLSDPQKGFNEISRVLKPGGQLLLHIPIKNNQYSLFWWKQKLFPKLAAADYREVGHSSDRMYTTGQITSFLNSNHLIITKKIYFNGFFTHLFDRELIRIISWIYSGLSKPKTPGQKTSASQTKNSGLLRGLYARVVVPLFELISLLDKPLSWLMIGNTYFCLSTKHSPNEYYEKNKSYSQFLDRSTQSDSQLYLDTIMKLLTPKQNFLDVGCGTGGNVNYLQNSGLSAFGIEISQTSLSLAKKRPGKYYWYDGETFPFASDHFAGVGCWNVLEHVANPDKFLIEMFRVIRPGGYLVIGTPNFLSLTNSYHPQVTGFDRKIVNSAILINKIWNLYFGNTVKFDRISPITNQPFFPDADAINLTNFPDLLKWGQLNNLHVISSFGSLATRSGLQKVIMSSPLKFITGGVFVVFRKTSVSHQSQSNQHQK